MADRRYQKINAPMTEAAKADDVTITGDWTFSGTVDLSTSTLSLPSIDTPLRVSDGASDYIDREVSASSSYVQDLTTGVASMVWDGDATLSGYYWQFNNSTKMQLSSAGQLYLPNTTDAGPSSTDHAFQIGADSGFNLRMDNNELMVVNNGSAADLQLNADGGTVQVNINTAGGLNVNRGGDLRVYDSNNTNYVRYYHDGSNGRITSSSGAVNIGGATVSLAPSGNVQLSSSGGGSVQALSGIALRAYDPDNTVYSAFICRNNTDSSGHDTSIDCTHGGKFRVQSASIADDATATFDIGGSYAMVFIVTTYNTTTFGMLGFTSTNAPTKFAGGTNLATGATNPDQDGRVNVWPSSSGTMSIKNRLGSTRSFYIFSLEP